jgi:hypothetical protein
MVLKKKGIESITRLLNVYSTCTNNNENLVKPPLHASNQEYLLSFLINAAVESK